MSDSHWDVVIIGAGMSGMAAGIRLAMYDKKVCVLEKHNILGGLNSFYKKDGRMFDVGLHAMTNFVPEGTRRAPLTKLLRQLRIRHAEFGLVEQSESEIWFPSARLRFSNDIELMRSQVAEVFPDQVDGFDRLVETVRTDEESLSLEGEQPRARAVLADYLTDPLLIDMILCPCFFYGSAREDDMDWGQFIIMFRSLMLEGLARPYEGVRRIIQVLRKKFLACGGTLRMKAGVESLKVDGDRVVGVTLEGGEQLTADKVLSSAGHVETLKMLSNGPAEDELPPKGKLAYVESISVLSKQARDLGYDKTITFFSTRDQLAYRNPEEAVDVSSGVVCAPGNFRYEEPLPEGMIRLTSLANHDHWFQLDDEEYYAQKKAWYDRSVAEVIDKGVVPEFRPEVVYVDSFTPRTVKKFTFHERGAIYGAPNKVRDGRTHLDNLFLCGTDQGFLGITGAMLSGISMANLHCLK